MKNNFNPSAYKSVRRQVPVKPKTEPIEVFVGRRRCAPARVGSRKRRASAADDPYQFVDEDGPRQYSAPSAAAPAAASSPAPACVSFSGRLCDPLEEDFKILEGKKGEGWLTGEIVSAYLALLARRSDAGTVKSFNSLFLPSLRLHGKEYVCNFEDMKGQTPESLLKFDMLLVPELVRETHWVLLVVIPSARVIKTYDSLHGFNSSTIKESAEALKAFLSVEQLFETRAENSPQQRNTRDCGVFALMTAESLTRGEEPFYSNAPEKVKKYRNLIAAHLRGHRSLPRRGQECFLQQADEWSSSSSSEGDDQASVHRRGDLSGVLPELTPSDSGDSSPDSALVDLAPQDASAPPSRSLSPPLTPPTAASPTTNLPASDSDASQPATPNKRARVEENATGPPRPPSSPAQPQERPRRPPRSAASLPTEYHISTKPQEASAACPLCHKILQGNTRKLLRHLTLPRAHGLTVQEAKNILSKRKMQPRTISSTTLSTCLGSLKDSDCCNEAARRVLALLRVTVESTKPKQVTHRVGSPVAVAPEELVDAQQHDSSEAEDDPQASHAERCRSAAKKSGIEVAPSSRFKLPLYIKEGLRACGRSEHTQNRYEHQLNVLLSHARSCLPEEASVNEWELLCHHEHLISCIKKMRADGAMAPTTARGYVFTALKAVEWAGVLWRDRPNYPRNLRTYGERLQASKSNLMIYGSGLATEARAERKKGTLAGCGVVDFGPYHEYTTDPVVEGKFREAMEELRRYSEKMETVDKWPRSVSADGGRVTMMHHWSRVVRHLAALTFPLCQRPGGLLNLTVRQVKSAEHFGGRYVVGCPDHKTRDQGECAFVLRPELYRLFSDFAELREKMRTKCDRFFVSSVGAPYKSGLLDDLNQWCAANGHSGVHYSFNSARKTCETEARGRRGGDIDQQASTSLQSVSDALCHKKATADTWYNKRTIRSVVKDALEVESVFRGGLAFSLLRKNLNTVFPRDQDPPTPESAAEAAGRLLGAPGPVTIDKSDFDLLLALWKQKGRLDFCPWCGRWLAHNKLDNHLAAIHHFSEAKRVAAMCRRQPAVHELVVEKHAGLEWASTAFRRAVVDLLNRLGVELIQRPATSRAAIREVAPGDRHAGPPPSPSASPAEPAPQVSCISFDHAAHARRVRRSAEWSSTLFPFLSLRRDFAAELMTDLMVCEATELPDLRFLLRRSTVLLCMQSYAARVGQDRFRMYCLVIAELLAHYGEGEGEQLLDDCAGEREYWLACARLSERLRTEYSPARAELIHARAGLCLSYFDSLETYFASFLPLKVNLYRKGVFHSVQFCYVTNYVAASAFIDGTPFPELRKFTVQQALDRALPVTPPVEALALRLGKLRRQMVDSCPSLFTYSNGTLIREIDWRSLN
ncbi:Ulp1 protease family [Olea europaea subsp. europaea]|uniref:Ulp1 protease family n=1 Tax=Olea europaea subsp. europaea TaxID=158383 RepID=A0A8S0TJD3_OLEEU|nr:Ulp1 protease family [Olea europaea subsp. europaea]